MATHTSTTNLNHTRSVPLPVSIRVGRKVVGHVRHGVFSKSIVGSKHLLREPRAIAFDVSSLEDAQNAGAQMVRVRDTETEITYQTAISTIWKRGFQFDRGWGEQIALPLDKWSQPGQPQQLPLFPGEVV